MNTSRKVINLLLVLSLGACASEWDKAQGQVIYHWEKENTGVKKFARDHSECMRIAEDWTIIPDLKNLLNSEEFQYDLKADWHSSKGVWASYVPYPGAMPLVVNSVRDDSNVDPKKYRMCMENRGYWHRRYDIPEITNIFVYRPQYQNQNNPFTNPWSYGNTRP